MTHFLILAENATTDSRTICLWGTPCASQLLMTKGPKHTHSIIAFTNFRIEWSIQWLFGHRFFVHEFFGLEVYAKILLSWPNLTCLFHHVALPRGFSTDGRNNPANGIFHFLQVPYIKPMHPEESNLRPQSRLQRWKRRRRLRLLEVEVKINATLDLRG